MSADAAGLIDPTLFPFKSSDVDTQVENIRLSASMLKTVGATVDEEVATIATSWATLPGCYEGPEQAAVYTLMEPSTAAAQEMKLRFESASTSIVTYSDVLAGLKSTITDLETAAADFRAQALNGYTVNAQPVGGLAPGSMSFNKPVKVSWNEHEPFRTKNTELLAEYAAVVSSAQNAAATCGAEIQALLTHLTEAPSAPAEYSPEDILGSPGATPWGYPVEAEKHPVASVLTGVWNWTGIGDIYDTSLELGGWDPTTGTWSWEKAAANWAEVPGQTWQTITGLAELGSALVLLNPMTALPALPGLLLTPGSKPGTTAFDDKVNTLLSAGGSLINYDHAATLAGQDGFHAYHEDGLAAGTEAVLNVATLFSPKALTKAGSVGDAASPDSPNGNKPPETNRVPVTAGDASKPGGASGPNIDDATGASTSFNPKGSALVVLDEAPADRSPDAESSPVGTTPREPDYVVVDQNKSGQNFNSPAMDEAKAAALEKAKNDEGIPVDDRTGDELRPPKSDGSQGWVWKWNETDGVPIPRNPGAGHLHPPKFPELEYDPKIGDAYNSNDGRKPGEFPEYVPVETWDPVTGEAGIKYVTHKEWKEWMDYQQQISGTRSPSPGVLAEYRVPKPGGGTVDFDGHTWRGDPPQEVFLEAKHGHAQLSTYPESKWSVDKAEALVKEAKGQVKALPPGAKLEWHVSDPVGAAAIKELLKDSDLSSIDVLFTPKI